MDESNHIEVWNRCLQIIKSNVPEAVFQKWFLPVKPISLVDSALTIKVPSDAHMHHLEEMPLVDILGKTLKRVIGEKAHLFYNIQFVNSTVAYPHQTLEVADNPPIAFPRNERETINPFVIPGIQKLTINPNLNPKYSFENFIEGPCNRLARSAGERVASTPGNNPFCPLFIHSGSGLGKTHLSQAIGLRVKQLHPEKIVLYVSANTFKTQYQNATVGNKVPDFLHFYEQIDVLILDDVQFFQGRSGTQNAFFHIFNYLQQAGKQLILTSDVAPGNLQNMETRLIQRFKWGLTAEILTPDFDTRVKIIKAKSTNEGIVLPDEIVNYLASKVTGSVRELEGTILTLLAHSTFNKESITLDLAKKVTQQIVNVDSSEISLERIRNTVCDYFKISPETIVSKTRKREIVQARQIAMYLVRNLTKTSLTSIGSQMGGKDHATVLHACSTVSDLIDTDRNIRRYVADLERQLKGGK